jgi:hypothetical protein
MTVQASKVASAKITASIQSGDTSSLLRTALMVGGAVLFVLLLIFLYKKFVQKKPSNEYFESNEYFAEQGADGVLMEEEEYPEPSGKSKQPHPME